VSWSPPKASSTLIVAAIFANVTKFFAFRTTWGLGASIGMKGSDAGGCGEFLPICVNLGIELFEVLNDSLSCEMARDIIGDDGEFLGISDGIKDAMSNGGGDGGYYNSMKAEDVVVLIS
jgi:hypothetical protein